MSSTVSAPSELLCDPLYSQLKEYLIQATGLAYYADKDVEFARRIHRRLSSFGALDCSAYLEVLRDSRQGPSELDALIAEITIGETYFFRHREHFDALRDIILPGIIARNAASRHLRIWCAGCADGAEPYSLSILLRRELAHLLSGWEIDILGTDINRQNLATAREGKFDDWCLRSTPDDLKRMCFRKEGRYWTIAPEYKKDVSFQVHNLANFVPTPFTIRNGFDLIVCRNVMIYFAPELMRRTVLHFHECLAPEGWLLVGPSEPNMTHFTSFRVLNAPGVTLYQKPSVTSQNPAEEAAFLTRAPDPLPPPGVLDIQQAASGRSVATLDLLRRYANERNWEDALRCCEELLTVDPLNPLVHFHCALVFEQAGNRSESERSLRRAIYLDRQSALSHYHLGSLLRSRGDLRQARRSFGNALELLNSRSDREILADADGLTVAELKKLVRMQMETLREKA